MGAAAAHRGRRGVEDGGDVGDTRLDGVEVVPHVAHEALVRLFVLAHLPPSAHGVWTCTQRGGGGEVIGAAPTATKPSNAPLLTMLKELPPAPPPQGPCPSLQPRPTLGYFCPRGALGTATRRTPTKPRLLHPALACPGRWVYELPRTHHDCRPGAEEDAVLVGHVRHLPQRRQLRRGVDDAPHVRLCHPNACARVPPAQKWPSAHSSAQSFQVVTEETTTGGSGVAYVSVVLLSRFDKGGEVDGMNKGPGLDQEYPRVQWDAGLRDRITGFAHYVGRDEAFLKNG